MAAQIFILRHWKKQVGIFLQNLELLKKQYNTDAIHDLRVSVKKLRAYLRLLRMLNKDMDYSVDFDETEQLFSLLGKHRDIEMGILLLGKFEKENQSNYSFFCVNLQSALQRSMGWLQPALTSYDTNVIRDLTSQLQKDLKDTASEEVSERIKSNIERDFSKSTKRTNHIEDHPHQVRKLFKDILYQAELSPKDKLPANLPLGKIKKILDRLGDWQDHEMLLNKVKHFRKDFIPSSREEFELLKQLEKDISGVKEQLLHSGGKIFNQL